MTTNRKTLLAASAVALVAVAATAGWLLRGSPVAAGEADALEARMALLESRQAEQFAQIDARLSALAGSRMALSAEAAKARQAQREEQRRLMIDPVRLRQTMEQRLASLETRFASQPVDSRWASDARAMVTDAVSNAAAQAGAKLGKGEVDCRGGTCRIVMAVPNSTNYEDVLTYLMTDLAEELPASQLVVMPTQDGTRIVNVFASRDGGGARPGHD